ncbi:MAG: hypothetical protein AN483_12875 [Aphanizomenon flos-aquae MDT14a]|jgi:hypothetical protein|uniref:Uncharacterized protein n=1 Tax=Aphanizomenon flos-aquae WA102 TaxID=1710896 RepID=A0A1B7X2Q4_APHFL|nr:MAG: hypothetical protein AN483_12875 [Aphanizomenon flos-aquae MDT14a]OBQ43613.1 MAG: hypothetical protein AN484_11455 [Aphanizomenon flos-aquae WA102]
MADIKKLKPGQLVYSVETQKLGNTELSIRALYRVRILEVNLEIGFVIASWNSNPRQKFYETSIKKWKTERPEPKKKVMGLDSY